jgi:hypothetical protein
MTLEQKVAARIDEVIAEALVTTETTFRDMGATGDELAENMARTRADLAAWRCEAIAEAVRFYSQPDAPTTRLQ